MARQQRLGAWAILALFVVACACPTSLSERFGGGEAQQGELPPAAQFDELVTASSIGPDNRPLTIQQEFSPSVPIIYAVAHATQLQEGTTLLARWFRDNAPIEDTPPIVAERGYDDVFVEFHIQPVGGAGFAPGDYRVLLYINGEPGPQVGFAVR